MGNRFAYPRTYPYIVFGACVACTKKFQEKTLLHYYYCGDTSCVRVFLCQFTEWIGYAILNTYCMVHLNVPENSKMIIAVRFVNWKNETKRICIPGIGWNIIWSAKAQERINRRLDFIKYMDLVWVAVVTSYAAKLRYSTDLYCANWKSKAAAVIWIRQTNNKSLYRVTYLNYRNVSPHRNHIRYSDHTYRMFSAQASSSYIFHKMQNS